MITGLFQTDRTLAGYYKNGESGVKKNPDDKTEYASDRTYLQKDFSW